MDLYDLKTLPGSDGEMTVHEDVEAMSKSYKTGEDLPFTATFKAAIAADSHKDEDGGDEDILDEEVVPDKQE